MNNYPSVILSGGNISHIHNAAVELQIRGILKKYYCTFSGNNDLYPFSLLFSQNWKKRIKGKTIKNFTNKKVVNIPFPYLFTQLLLKFRIIDTDRANFIFSVLFDKFTMNKNEKCDIFHFVNSVGLTSAKRHKKNGSIIVCDIRAAHFCFEEELLLEEYDKLNLVYKSNKAKLKKRILEEYEISDYLIVPSDYVKETFIKYGVSEKKIIKLRYGVDLSKFEVINKNDTIIINKRDYFRVLFVGNGLPGKGLHYLIDAFENLNLPNSELLIIGWVDETYKKLLLSKINKSNVKFLGRIPQIELKEYYSKSDVFVLPTLSEGSANVINEAMAAGLPVITTTNSGSVIQDGLDGYIVPIRNSFAIEERISWLYKSLDIRNEIGNSGKNRIKEYTWDKYRFNLINIYEKLLNERNIILKKN